MSCSVDDIISGCNFIGKGCQLVCFAQQNSGTCGTVAGMRPAGLIRNDFWCLLVFCSSFCFC